MDVIKRSFLRACMNHGAITVEMANEILTKLCNEYKVDKPNNLEDYVAEINNQINEYNQQLTKEIFGLNNSEYIIFAFTKEIYPNTHHPTLTDNEKSYFGVVLDKMIQSVDYSIQWNQAYNSDVRLLSSKRMVELMKLWTKQGYFFEKDTITTFGPRLIVEFDFYLRSHYPNYVQECPLCKKLVFWDIKCNICQVKLHRHCMRKYLRMRSNCPQCQKKWTTRLSC